MILFENEPWLFDPDILKAHMLQFYAEAHRDEKKKSSAFRVTDFVLRNQ